VTSRTRQDGASGRRALGRVGRSRLLVALAVIGPGIIAANADNDAGGVTTWSVVGSRYGFSMLWLLVVITPILALTQEMGARMGAVTGKGLAALIRERFSLRLTAFAMLALLVANFATTVSEYAGMAAAFGLAGIPGWAAVPPLAAGLWLLITRGDYRRVERVFLALSAIYVTYFVAVLLADPDWHAAARGLVPSLQRDSAWLMTAVAAVGTTITPWGQFFIQAYVVDKRISIREYGYTKAEVYTGAVITDLVSFFILAACAATLFREGVAVETAEDAARALGPLAGEFASALFGIGLLNVSLLGAGVLPLATAYAVCEAFGFESSLDKDFHEAPVFYGLLTFFVFVPALVAVIPGIPLVGLILLAQNINGVLLPVILIYVLRIVNDPAVMGEHVNGRVYNVLAWAFSVALIGLSLTLVVSPLL